MSTELPAECNIYTHLISVEASDPEMANTPDFIKLMWLTESFCKQATDESFPSTAPYDHAPDMSEEQSSSKGFAEYQLIDATSQHRAHMLVRLCATSAAETIIVTEPLRGSALAVPSVYRCLWSNLAKLFNCPAKLERAHSEQPLYMWICTCMPLILMQASAAAHDGP